MIIQNQHPIYKLPKIITSGAFLVVTDYKMLPEALQESWIFDFTDNYLIYDRAHRFEESDKIKHQKNVGANIYDIFDYIVTNYENLPDTIIFCKGNTLPRHCGFRKFIEIINNKVFTTIENYIREAPVYQPGISGFVTDNDEYYEHINIVNGQVAGTFGFRYIDTYQSLLYSIFENPTIYEYTRFAPGANHIIPKSDILKYNKYFYQTMREYVSWNRQPGEAYLIERALYTLYNNDFIIQQKYKNN